MFGDSLKNWLGNRSETIKLGGSDSFHRANVEESGNGQKIVAAIKQLKEEEGLALLRDDRRLCACLNDLVDDGPELKIIKNAIRAGIVNKYIEIRGIDDSEKTIRVAQIGTWLENETGSSTDWIAYVINVFNQIFEIDLVVEADAKTTNSEKSVSNKSGSAYRGIEWFEKEAEKGNAEFQYEVGMYYKYLINTSERINGRKMCYKWLEMAAKAGIKDAMYEYGSLFRYDSDESKADSEKYQYWVGKAETYGISKSREYKTLQIFEDFKVGYEQGDIDASLRYAMCVGQSDKEQSRAIYEILANKGSGLALFLLGNDIDAETADSSEMAIKYSYYKKAAEKGNLGAKYEMIEASLKGEYVEKNPKLAKEYCFDVMTNHNSSFVRGVAQFFRGEIALFALDGDFDYESAKRDFAYFAHDNAIGEEGVPVSEFLDAADDVINAYATKFRYLLDTEEFTSRMSNLQVMFMMKRQMGFVLDLN